MTGKGSLRRWHLSQGSRTLRHRSCKDLGAEHPKQKKGQILRRVWIWVLKWLQGGQCSWSAVKKEPSRDSWAWKCGQGPQHQTLRVPGRNGDVYFNAVGHPLGNTGLVLVTAKSPAHRTLPGTHTADTRCDHWMNCRVVNTLLSHLFSRPNKQTLSFTIPFSSFWVSLSTKFDGK